MKKIVWPLLLICLASNAMLSQMEMGQAKREMEERSTLQACGDCICDPNLCFNVVLLNKTFDLALDKT